MKVKAQLAVPEVKEGSLRVAFATKDGETVNDHFGWAKEFVFYDVNAEGYTLAGKVVFEGEELDELGNDDKLTGKIEALEGCHIIYSEAIGGPAAARLTRKRIQPLVVKGENSIKALLQDFIATLNGPTPPWLRKLTGQKDPRRFEQFDDEDDD